MYDRKSFIARFTNLDTQELLLMLAKDELVEDAKSAITEVLRNRGFSSHLIEQDIKEKRRAYFRSSSREKSCDCCNKKLGNRYLKVDGQKFCSNYCLRKLRIKEASLEYSESDVRHRALTIKSGICPICSESGKVEYRQSYKTYSLIAYTKWWQEKAICCHRCGVKANVKAIFYCLLLGWWGIPLGVMTTPFFVVANIVDMLRARSNSEPSMPLLDHSKNLLAEQYAIENGWKGFVQ